MDAGPFEAPGCTKATVSASGRGSDSDDTSSCILLNDVKDTCGNFITVDGKDGTGRIGAVLRGELYEAYASASHVNVSTLKEGGGGSFGGARASESGAAESSTSDYSQESAMMHVKSALSKHASAVLTLLRHVAATGETCVPEPLLNPVREETMTALQNALSKTENEAVRLYNEEIARKDKTTTTKRKQQRLEATMNDGGTENERYGTKSVLASANSDLPATSKRARSSNENKNGPEKKKSKGQRKTCSRKRKYK